MTIGTDKGDAKWLIRQIYRFNTPYDQAFPPPVANKLPKRQLYPNRNGLGYLQFANEQTIGSGRLTPPKPLRHEYINGKGIKALTDFRKPDFIRTVSLDRTSVK